MEATYSTELAKLNDKFRRSGSGVTITPGVQGLPDLSELLEEIRWYEQFAHDPEEDGDEHDLGAINWYGNRVLWKIDYYDQQLEYGEDPLSLDCRRVLTVMLASEY